MLQSLVENHYLRVSSLLSTGKVYIQLRAKRSASLDKARFWDVTVGGVVVVDGESSIASRVDPRKEEEEEKLKLKKERNGQMFEVGTTIVAELKTMKTEAKEYRYEIIRFFKEQKGRSGQE